MLYLHIYVLAQGKQRVTTVSVLTTNNVRIRYGHGLTAGSVSRTPCTYVMGHFIRTYNTAPVETPVQARLVPWRSPFCKNTDRLLSVLTPSLSTAADPVFSRVYSPVTTLNGVTRATYSRSRCACIEKI